MKKKKKKNPTRKHLLLKKCEFQMDEIIKKVRVELIRI